MKSFKKAAKEVLRKVGNPLHYKEITDKAIQQGLLETKGETPWATMNALLSVDIKQNGEKSPFIRTDPGYYALRQLKIKVKEQVKVKAKKAKAIIVRHQINPALNPKEKGDIAESRVAELITLYCKEPLVCYRPISDIEGIDVIVKKKDELNPVYIQVKSTFGFTERGFVSKLKENKILNKKDMVIVFVYFDLSGGDLYDQLFCIPAPEFLRLTTNKNKKNPNERIFTAGLSRPDKSKFARFMIEKRELANKIIEIINGL